MSLFTVGKRYQGEYTVEHVVNFFDGELAIANFLDERYYLQSVPLVREFTTLEFHRFKKLYDELDFELLLPVSNMFLEGNYAVFVYPYEPIQPIRDIVTSTGVSDEEILGWFHQIVETEIALQSMGIPMYIIRDPRNIGLNTNRELRVIFTAIEDVTLTESTINWGTFFYCVASGDYVDESLKRLPSNHSLARPVAKLIQRSFRAKNLQDLHSLVQQAMKKKKGGGLIGSIFGKKKKDQPANDPNPQRNSNPLTIETPSSQLEAQPQQDNQALQLEHDLHQETVNWSEAIEQTNKQEEKEQASPTQGESLQEPDPFHQQLEEMYEAIERESQSNQQSLDQTQIYTKQEQQNDAINQPSVDDLQQANTQVLHSDQLSSASVETSFQTEPEQHVSEQATQHFTRKSSQDSLVSDQTQIFSASDLSSIEAELKEMEQTIQAEKDQAQKEQAEQEVEKLEQTVVQPASDDLEQLEKLFGELDQLQHAQQTDKTNEQQVKQTQPTEEQVEQSEIPSQPIANLDQKMKEIESLFEELNQGQIQEDAVSTIEQTSTTQANPEVEKPSDAQEDKTEEVAASVSEEKTEHHDSTVQEPSTEDDPLEKLRIEFEQEQKKLLERQQQRLKERQQALIVEVQEELKRRQEELLREIEQQEEKMLLELEEEFQRRKLEEMRKIELNTLKKKHDQDVKNGLAEIRKAYQEQEEKELKQLDQEYQQRREEIMNQYREKRLKEENEFKTQKAKEWKEVLKKFNETNTEDGEDQASASVSKEEAVKEKKKSAKKKGKQTSHKKASKKKETKKEKQSPKNASSKAEKTNHDESASQVDDAQKEWQLEEVKETVVLSENNKVDQQP